MNEYMVTRELTLTESQLRGIDHVELSPRAREILKKAKVRWAADLSNGDAKRAAEVARELIREAFTIKEG